MSDSARDRTIEAVPAGSGLLFRAWSRIDDTFPVAGQWLMRVWYSLLSRVDRNGDVRFMNYGYQGPEPPLVLPAAFERDRYSVQLYHRVATAEDVENRDVLEIGCGRGGGAAYIAECLRPRSYVGLDLCEPAVAFCRRTHAREALSFTRGDAQNLPLPDESVDVVLNIESSHRYTDVARFLSEVRRVLRAGGVFLYSDFRSPKALADLRETIRHCGLVLRREEMLSEGVLRALTLESRRKSDLITRMVPAFFRTEAREFAGTDDSLVFRQFAAHERQYFLFVLGKDAADRAHS
jgi:ubiquinone/menaquinone biosynthesis C-methylase UbiE